MAGVDGVDGDASNLSKSDFRVALEMGQGGGFPDHPHVGMSPNGELTTQPRSAVPPSASARNHAKRRVRHKCLTSPKDQPPNTLIDLALDLRLCRRDLHPLRLHR
jgi:hypothetical protein